MPRGNPAPKLAITVAPDVHARVVDAAVVTLAIKHGANVLTGDGEDIRLLVAAAGVALDVYDI